MSKLYRPTECANVNCVAMCSLSDYDFRKGFFGNNPTKCPNYKKETSNTIAELEKIKAEIEDLKTDLLKYNCHKCWRREETCKQKYHCESCNELAEIIDKHISELKGE